MSEPPRTSPPPLRTSSPLACQLTCPVGSEIRLCVFVWSELVLSGVSGVSFQGGDCHELCRCNPRQPFSLLCDVHTGFMKQLECILCFKFRCLDLKPLPIKSWEGGSRPLTDVASLPMCETGPRMTIRPPLYHLRHHRFSAADVPDGHCIQL